MPQEDPGEIYQNPLRHFLFHQIFNILKNGPAHGYQIMLDVEKNTGGCWRPSTAMVYRALSEMDECGHVTSTEEKVGDKTRRVYSITPLGKKEEERKEKEISRLVHSILSPALESGSKIPPGMLYMLLSPHGRTYLDEISPQARRVAARQLVKQMRVDLEWLESILAGKEITDD